MSYNGNYMSWICSISTSQKSIWSISVLCYCLSARRVPSLSLRPLPLSVHCFSSGALPAGWWLTLGSALADSEGRRRRPAKKWWHFTAIIHLCFVPATPRSVCTGMERRVEGCWDAGMNSAGCEWGKTRGRGGREGVLEVKKSRG